MGGVNRKHNYKNIHENKAHQILSIFLNNNKNNFLFITTIEKFNKWK